MVPAGNKAKRLLLVNHTTKTIHHHHHHHHQESLTVRSDISFKLKHKSPEKYWKKLRETILGRIAKLVTFDHPSYATDLRIYFIIRLLLLY